MLLYPYDVGTWFKPKPLTCTKFNNGEKNKIQRAKGSVWLNNYNNVIVVQNKQKQLTDESRVFVSLYS